MPKMNAEQKAEAQAKRLSELDEGGTLASVPEEIEIEEISPEPTPKRLRATAHQSKPADDSDLFANFEDTKDFVNLLLWGREGSGKTTDALSAANLGKVLVINAEGGLKKKALLKRGINLDNVRVYPRPGERPSYEGLEAALLRVQSDLMDDPNSWFAVIFDSLTEGSAEFVEAVSDDRTAKSRAKGAKIDLYDSFFVDRSDYGTAGKMLRKLLRMMRDLQCHTIITALERRDVDEDTSKVSYGPAVPPGVQSDVLGYVDLVMYCREPDEEHDYFRALTRKAGTRRAKDRFDSFPQILVEPTFERVIGYLDDDLEELTDPLQAKLSEEKPKATKTATRTRAARTKTPATPTAEEADS